ncbi:MAG: desulfoferrodoxin [Bacilli bacterium]|nr:desulfoferrodoxin [Bacilli bacterium]
MRFFKCNKCGNVVALVDDKSSELACCGEKMMELIPRAVDAAVEKHVPKIFIDENIVDIKVGEVSHPMEKEHYIPFIAIETNCGIEINKLSPGSEPETRFILDEDEELYTTYAYCNKHGLWTDK